MAAVVDLEEEVAVEDSEEVVVDSETKDPQKESCL